MDSEALKYMLAVIMVKLLILTDMRKDHRNFRRALPRQEAEKAV